MVEFTRSMKPRFLSYSKVAFREMQSIEDCTINAFDRSPWFHQRLGNIAFSTLKIMLIARVFLNL